MMTFQISTGRMWRGLDIDTRELYLFKPGTFEARESMVSYGTMLGHVFGVVCLGVAYALLVSSVTMAIAGCGGHRAEWAASAAVSGLLTLTFGLRVSFGIRFVDDDDDD